MHRHEWRVMVAETVTGTLVADIAPRDLPSFTRAVTDKGRWTVNVLPDDRRNAGLDLHAYTDAGRYSWLIAYGPTIAQAGPVWTYSYSDSTRNLSVSGAGIQSLFDRRVLRDPDGDPTLITNTSNDLVLEDYTLRGLAREIVAANLSQPGYGLPMDLPDPETGDRRRTYEGYDLAMVWDRLTELSDVIDGPELDFRPYFAPGETAIRWEMRIGSPELGDPTFAGVWDYGAALTSLATDVNGSASPAMRAWSKGSGSERNIVTGYAADDSLTDLGFPPADYVDTEHMSVKKTDTAVAHAQAALDEFAAPVETWDCTIRVDGVDDYGTAVSPPLGHFALGDVAHIGVDGHPWIPPGMYRRRITGVSSHTESLLTLAVEPTPEVI